VPTDRAGVELFDDWDGFGQRLTASGGTRFTDVEAYKAYAAGNYAVNATWPPANGYF
jgi:alkylation response protein AidB-like acyl-CoA dehydrogenase